MEDSTKQNFDPVYSSQYLDKASIFGKEDTINCYFQKGRKKGGALITPHESDGIHQTPVNAIKR